MKTRLIVILLTIVVLSACVPAESVPARPTSTPEKWITVKIPTSTIPWGKYVNLHNPSGEIQMFGGSTTDIKDVVVGRFANDTRCIEITTRSFDIGASTPVKYGYLECGYTRGWVNAKWYH